MFEERFLEGCRRVIVTCGSGSFGEPLTDAAPVDDGYRFHDVIHLAFAVMLGWSPVTRRNINCKRRSDPIIDETQDGGRAIVIEEAVAAYVYAYAKRHALLDGVTTIDYATLRTMLNLTEPFEVSVRTAAEWQAAILEAMRVYRLLLKHRRGVVHGDLGARILRFEH